MNTSTCFEAAYETFLQNYPGFQSTRSLDNLRNREYARLDDGNHTYLDYTGGGRPGGERSRVEAFDDQPYRQNHFLQGQRDEQDIGQGGVGIPRP